jgi:hypothetical protein|tara:strand:- start:4077 stop:4259 length:183 start_codon:yes stop_codon:yes gene_type:complete
MWVLVYIVLIGEPKMAVIEPPFKTLNECFSKRDELLVQMGLYSGRFPQGVGAFCIRARKE